VQNNISGKYEKLQKRLPNILRTPKSAWCAILSESRGWVLRWHNKFKR